MLALIKLETLVFKFLSNSTILFTQFSLAEFGEFQWSNPFMKIGTSTTIYITFIFGKFYLMFFQET